MSVSGTGIIQSQLALEMHSKCILIDGEPFSPIELFLAGLISSMQTYPLNVELIEPHSPDMKKVMKLAERMS